MPTGIDGPKLKFITILCCDICQFAFKMAMCPIQYLKTNKLWTAAKVNEFFVSLRISNIHEDFFFPSCFYRCHFMKVPQRCKLSPSYSATAHSGPSLIL